MKHNGYQLVCESIDQSDIYINLPSSRQQVNYSCGAVCLRSIAKYYGKDLDNEKEFRDLCNAGKTKGSHPEEIVRAANLFGFDAEIKEDMSIQELTNYIQNRIPVIVAIQAWGNEKDPQKRMEDYSNLKDGHYVIAIGFNDDNIYFEDPSVKGSRTILSKQEFLKRWIDKESYPEKIVTRLGIIIRSNEKPKDKQIINKTKKLI
jgi:predicted double-glycine peptidase